MPIPIIPADKANHVVYGAAIAAVLSIILGPLPALLAAGLVGALKELADAVSNWQARRAGLVPMHGVEWLDFAATLAGGALVALPQLLTL